jgi:hypothetical protein
MGSFLINWFMKYCKMKAVQEDSMNPALVTPEKYIIFFTVGYGRRLLNGFI